MTVKKSKSKSEITYPYTATVHYKIGVTDCVCAWNMTAPLSPTMLEYLINLIKTETGTTKDIFISNISVIKKD